MALEASLLINWEQMSTATLNLNATVSALHRQRRDRRVNGAPSRSEAVASVEGAMGTRKDLTVSLACASPPSAAPYQQYQQVDALSD